jgi:tetratricopeptide (TPR) repeat protein
MGKNVRMMAEKLTSSSIQLECFNISRRSHHSPTPSDSAPKHRTRSYRHVRRRRFHDGRECYSALDIFPFTHILSISSQDAGDDDDYDFEYEDDGDADDAMDDGDNDVENQYYLAKGESMSRLESMIRGDVDDACVAEKEDDPEKALKAFRKIVDSETEKGEWSVSFSDATCRRAESRCWDRGFKALKQSTKILYLTLHRPEEALETYRELLGYVKVSHSRSESRRR